MANIATGLPIRAFALPRFRLAVRYRVLLRSVRCEHQRRRTIDQLLAETRDPRILADVGFAVPRPTIIERWAVAMLHHRR